MYGIIQKQIGSFHLTLMKCIKVTMFVFNGYGIYPLNTNTLSVVFSAVPHSFNLHLNPKLLKQEIFS